MLTIINSDPLRRSFKMIIGLCEGYSPSHRIQHDMGEVESIVGAWLVRHEKLGNGYLPGQLDYRTQQYARDGIAITEPSAIYEGEVNPIYNGHATDPENVGTLTELADLLSNSLKQQRIYLCYRDQLFILENENLKRAAKRRQMAAKRRQRSASSAK